MTSGRLTFVYTNDLGVEKSIDCETVTDISDEISATVMVTPIVTYDSENSFAFDTSSNESFTITFKRKSPVSVTYNSLGVENSADPEDCSTWSNRKWKEEMQALIDRWQARSDGCRMYYTPLDSACHCPITALNVYIRSISFNNTVESYELISGTMNIQVGSMTNNRENSPDGTLLTGGYGDEVSYNDMTITMTTPEGEMEFTIYSKAIDQNSNVFEINCVSEYNLKGGPEQPFEYLTMRISKKRLSAVAPELVDNIYPGRNRIKLRAIGVGEYTVTKCSTSGQYYKIVAYSIYEIYRSAALSTNIPFGASGARRPSQVLQAVLLNQSDFSIGNTPIYFTEKDVFFFYRNENDFWSTETTGLQFASGASAWYIISVCALRMNCKVWFSNGKAFIIDTSLTASDLADAHAVSYFNALSDPKTPGVVKSTQTDIAGIFGQKDSMYLNLNDPYPLYLSAEDREFPTAVRNTISLGDEGAETIHNKVIVNFNKDHDSRHDANSDLYTELKYKSQPGRTWTGLARTPIPGATDQYWYDTVDLPDKIQMSQEAYGVKSVTYDIAEIDDTDANAIAFAVADSNCDSEQSVGFELKETRLDSEGIRRWRARFAPVTHVNTVIDYSNDLMDSNRSNYAYADVTVRGKWSAEVTYSLGEYVTYDGKLYRSNANNNTMNVPNVPTPIPGPTGWNYLAREIDGWDEGVHYSEGDLVIWDDLNEIQKVYVAVTSSLSEDPAVSSSWDEKGPYCGTYDPSSSYDRHDVVYSSEGLEGAGYYRAESARGPGEGPASTTPIWSESTDRSVHVLPNKLTMSTYERIFPDGVTKYWFGIIKPTDVTQNSSEITTALYRR